MQRIARVETFHNEFVCFVRVTAEDGAFGWGQTSTYNADITAQVLHRQVVPWALGADAGDIAGLIALIERREHKYPGSYRCRALAGLDTALWDMAGRRAEKPVASLIGGGPGRVRAYASSMKRDITPKDEAERLTRKLRKGHPDLLIVARARDTGHAAELYRAGASHAVPETLESSLQLSEAVLVDIGVAMGPVIASIHEKRDEFRAKIEKEGALDYKPKLRTSTVESVS